MKNREWATFEVGELFEIISGKDIVLSKNKGPIPYINSSGVNNGVTAFIKNGKVYVENVITVARTGTVGATFYQTGKVCISGNVRALKPKNGLELNSNIALFFIISFRKSISGNFSYGKILGTERIKRQKVKLPILKDKTPDWSFMDNFVEEKKNEIIKKISPIDKNEVEDDRSLVDLEWGQFKMDDIFIIKSGVRLTKANMKPGKIPFIGATDSNNGITQFTSTINASLDSNVLGVNYNGSVVENFYHPYEAVFSDDVKRLKLKNYPNNKYVLLFMKTVILQQKVKYAYGYKFNGARMKAQIIFLPTKEDATPDYEFMEQYMKRMENKVIERTTEKEADQ